MWRMNNDTHIGQGCRYYSCHFAHFSKAYARWHPSISLAICIGGVVSNGVIVLVLRRPRMRSAVNVILTAIAVAQLLLTTNYVALLGVDHMRRYCDQAAWSLWGARYRLANVNLNTVLHTVAFFHTVFLAVFRAIAVRLPLFARRHLMPRRQRRVSVACGVSTMLWLGVPVICTPVYFATSVRPTAHRHNCSSLGAMFDLYYSDDRTLVRSIFWTYGVGLKLAPCAALALSVAYLVASLRRTSERRRKLTAFAAPTLTVDRTGAGVRRCHSASYGSMSRFAPQQTRHQETRLGANSDRKQSIYRHRRYLHVEAGRTVSNLTVDDGTSEVRSVSETSHQSRSTSISPNREPSSRGQPQSNASAGGGIGSTSALLTVVALCLAVELPHGLLNLLTAVLGPTAFGAGVYDQVGDLVEMLTLLYSSLNFCLYCAMSRQFRLAFVEMFTEAVGSSPARQEVKECEEMATHTLFLGNSSMRRRSERSGVTFM